MNPTPTELDEFNAGVQRARAEYDRQVTYSGTLARPTINQPCRDCGVTTRARHGLCKTCQKEQS